MLFGLLRELSIYSESLFLRVEGTSLSYCWGIGSVRLQDLGPSINIVLPNHVLFVFIQVFCVRYHSLETLWFESVSDIGSLFRFFTLRRSMMHMHKLRLLNQLIATTWSKYLSSLRSLRCVVFPEEILAWINVLITHCIRLEFFKSILASSTWISHNSFYLSTFTSFNTYSKLGRSEALRLLS